MYEKAKKKTQIACVFFYLNMEVRRLPVSLNEVWTHRSTSRAKLYATTNGGINSYNQLFFNTFIK